MSSSRDPRFMLPKVQYQLAQKEYDCISNGFAQLDVHFPRVAFGDRFGCKQPTRFTRDDIVKKINDVSKELVESSGSEQIDLAAHLQVWSALLRIIGSVGDEYDVFVWF